MGNNFESNNENIGRFNMEVFINKLTFFPGETIKGDIKLSNKYINIPQILNFPKFYFALIHRECWKRFENIDKKDKNKINGNFINEPPDNTSDNYNQKILYGNNEIYNDLKNKEIKDSLTIPFQIKIPLDAKPSFEYTNGNKSYGYSRIYIDIEIPETYNKKEILIFIQKIPTPLNSELFITKNLTKKKLLGSGTNINFQSSYPKNYFGFGEDCPLSILFDNVVVNDTLKGLSFSLKRKIIFIKNNLKVSEEYIEELWQYKMKENNLSKNINFNIPLLETNKIINEKKSSVFDINSICKENLICLLPSYEGQLIKCQYYIAIKILYESLLKKNSEIEMPIDLGHSQSVFNQTFILDVNKILGKINETMITSLMVNDFPYNNINKIGENNSQANRKLKMQDIFGINQNSQKDESKQENENKIFEDDSKDDNIKMDDKFDKPMSGNSDKKNSGGNINNSNSMNQEDKGDNNDFNDQQAAPGIIKKP